MRAKETAAKPKPKKLSAAQKKEIRDMLLAMRDRLQGQITALRGDSLVRDDDVITGEDGSDFFERQFALNIASSEHDSVVEIDEALRRLDEGTYGACEECGELIESPRLRALPFVRRCIRCQSHNENGKVRFRPVAAPEEI
jgi:RNA polymerase-binding transcription factor DksA